MRLSFMTLVRDSKSFAVPSMKTAMSCGGGSLARERMVQGLLTQPAVAQQASTMTRSLFIPLSLEYARRSVAGAPAADCAATVAPARLPRAGDRGPLRPSRAVAG